MSFKNNGRIPVENKSTTFDRTTKSSAMKAMFEVLFDHENRIRALENKQPISRQVALAAFKAKFVG